MLYYSYKEKQTYYKLAMILDHADHHNRKAAVAGRFYEGDKPGLQTEILKLYSLAKKAIRPGKSPLALIVPHAGYIFSGKVAASGFNQLPEQAGYKRIFILASSHQIHFSGASIYTSGNYETPLGMVEVDKETGQELIRMSRLFSDREDAHLIEHSLEVQLPFLQMKLPSGFRLVPIILGTQSRDECRLLAETLQPWMNHENLFVVSTDLSHYPGYDDAVQLDRLTAESILTASAETLLSALQAARKKRIPGLVTSMCGWTSVLTLMYMIQDKDTVVDWVDYQNSGDQPKFGDQDRVVGYGSFAVYNRDKAEFHLTEKEKQDLLGIAEESVRTLVLHGERISTGHRFTGGNLSRRAGAFVSIYISGKLRGCIGSFENEFPLAEVVCRSASSAARDQRFESPHEDELKEMTFEISVLTPLRRIHSMEEVEPGRHGIYIRKDLNSGTFLPQVAKKYGWNRKEFLGRCSRDKAGLGWEGWKDAELYTYEAIIFSSNEISMEM